MVDTRNGFDVDRLYEMRKKHSFTLIERVPSQGHGTLVG